MEALGELSKQNGDSQSHHQNHFEHIKKILNTKKVPWQKNPSST